MATPHGIDDPLNDNPPKETPQNPSDVSSDSDSIWGSDDDETSLSQVIRVRREHHTTGYVDGLTAYKDEALQVGFDESFPIGAQIGLQVGQIIGALQGLGLKELENQALEELSAEKLFCPTYWDKEANKSWEGDTHPLIANWIRKLNIIQTGQA